MVVRAQTEAGSLVLTLGEAVWVGTALLHRENPTAADFKVQEIKTRILEERLPGALDADGRLRPGIEVHVRLHCVANRPRNPAQLRMLMATGSGRRRLFRSDDVADPSRQGAITPRRESLPEQYRYLLDWYGAQYDIQAESAQATGETLAKHGGPLLALLGLGREIWRDEKADDYVRRLRENWE